MKCPSQPVRRLSTALLATAALCWSAAQAANLYVFGDSLSDSGNIAIAAGADPAQIVTSNVYIPARPYAEGTFTNGEVWVSHYAEELEVHEGAVPSRLGGSNFAHGGSRAATTPAGGLPPSAVAQLNQLLARKVKLRPDDLFVIAVGGNDVRDTATAVAQDPANAANIIGAAAGNFAAAILGMVDTLQARHVRHILVWNVPNLGLTPLARTAGPATAGLLTSISSTFNAVLAGTLAGEPGVEIFDSYGTLEAMVANPSAYGLTNATDASGARPDSDPDTWLFWDGIHPTAAGHALLAEAVLDAWSPLCVDKPHRHHARGHHQHGRKARGVAWRPLGRPRYSVFRKWDHRAVTAGKATTSSQRPSRP